jgi:hypothetical protein
MAADENLPDDAPEADALDQRQEVLPSDDPEASPGVGGPSVDTGFEVPEADALDQAREVPTDDEPDPESA